MLRHTLILPLLLATPAAAEMVIATDLPLTAGLVSAVTGDLATVTPVFDAQTDPHGAALRPGQARDLSRADLVVIIGGGLMPGVESGLDALAEGRILSLAGEVEHHDEDHHDNHGALHPWLDPEVVRGWVETLAAEMSTRDEINGPTYAANAEAARDEIAEVADAVEVAVGGLYPAGMLAVHDAWGAAVEAFGLPVVATISDSEAHSPSVRRLSEIEATLRAGDVACILAAPGDDRGQADRLSEEFSLPIVTVPLTGVSGEGVAVYTGLLEALGAAAAECAAG
ncbi:metal ABC transporter substrate-binding protein [Palleronia caenipelagi]|nr:metal ABC transporter substrate-binding protein [Palleronia caenipelagi]